MEIDNNTLDKVHSVLLEMIDEVDRICRKHDIVYFLEGGTALGQVRHGGFIPWDDDVDLVMLRNDYNKFIEIAKKELNPNYVVQTHENEPLYTNFHLKIRKLYTIYPQGYNKDYNYKGIQLDIFPFDNIPDNKFVRLIYQRRVRLFRRFIVIYVRPVHGNILKRLGQKFIKAIMKTVYGESYRVHFERLCAKYDEKETKCVTSHISHYSWKKDLVFRKTAILPVKDARFEDRTYLQMNEPKDLLTEKFGSNYMELPPEEKRHTHLIGEVIFDTRLTNVTIE